MCQSTGQARAYEPDIQAGRYPSAAVRVERPYVDQEVMTYVESGRGRRTRRLVLRTSGDTRPWAMAMAPRRSREPLVDADIER